MSQHVPLIYRNIPKQPNTTKNIPKPPKKSPKTCQNNPKPPKTYQNIQKHQTKKKSKNIPKHPIASLNIPIWDILKGPFDRNFDWTF